MGRGTTALEILRRSRDRLLPPGAPARKALDRAALLLASTPLGRMAPSGYLELAAWPSADALLLWGWFPLLPGEALRAEVVEGGRKVELQAHVLAVPRPDCQGLDPRMGKVVVLRGLAGRRTGLLVLRPGARRLEARLEALDAAAVSPGRWAWAAAGLSPGLRAELAAFVATASAPADASVPGAAQWGAALCELRDAARAPVARWGGEKTEPRAAHVDSLFGIDEHHLLLIGWARDAVASISRASALSPEGVRVDLAGHLHWMRSEHLDWVFGDDPEDLPGPARQLVALVRCPIPTVVARGWILELEDASGFVFEACCPEVVHRNPRARDEALRLWAAGGWAPALMEDVVHPAVERVQGRLRAVATAWSSSSWGPVPEAPTVSVVVPLGEREGQLEQLLAQLAGDAELERAELLFVVEGKERAAELTALAPDLHEIYRLPFRLVEVELGLGPGLDLHAGALAARAPRLLFLGADVMPERPGWLGRLAAFADAHPGLGAVSPTILEDEEAVASAGFELVAGPQGGRSLVPRLQGAPRGSPAAQAAAVVGSASPACLLVGRDDYLAAGGLRGRFLTARAEAADLCQRLSQGGHRSWCCPEVELIEPEKVPDASHAAARRHDAWLLARAES